MVNISSLFVSEQYYKCKEDLKDATGEHLEEEDKAESLMELQETTMSWFMEIKVKLFLIISLCYVFFYYLSLTLIS